MLKKINRLAKNKDFDNLFKKGKSSYNKIIGFKYIKNGLAYNRFGIIISTKVSKKAVIRNKIKRQNRAIIRKNEKDIKQGFDMSFVVFPLILDKKFQEIEDNIKNTLSKIKLFI